MTIEEVDSILLAGEEMPSKTLGYIVLAFTLFFWATGAFILALAIAVAWQQAGAIISAVVSTLFRWDVMAIMAGIFGFMILVAFTYLLLIRKFARELLMALYLILGLGLIISGTFILSIGAQYVGAVLIGGLLTLVGVIIIILFFMFKERISLAGRMIELSAEAVMDEKGILALIILKAIVIAWTIVSWFISLFYWAIIVYGVAPQEYNILSAGLTLLVMFFMGLWTVMFWDAFFSAAIVRIVHDWYRSPEVDVASAKKGLSKAWEVSGLLAKYALVFAILSFIIYIARSSAEKERGVGAALARFVAWIVGITEDLLRFLGFYMIPAMVIRKLGFKDSLKDSVHKLRDLFVETIAGMYGFGIVLGFIAFITASIMGAVGYFIGVMVIAGMLGVDPFVAGIAMGVGFFVLSFIPMGLVISAVSVAWRTMLYEYGLDIEFSAKGVVLPSRLPEDVKAAFAEAIEKRKAVVAVV